MLEDTNTINIPDFSEQPKKFNPLDNLRKRKVVEKELLPKRNRDICCSFCGTTKTLNPTQYQAYFDYWGDEDKIARNFICQPCDTYRKDNPFKFWLEYSEQSKKLSKKLKAIFEIYASSQKTDQDKLSFNNMFNNTLQEFNIWFTENWGTNCELLTENKLPIGAKVKKFPFIDQVFEIRPYETKFIKFL